MSSEKVAEAAHVEGGDAASKHEDEKSEHNEEAVIQENDAKGEGDIVSVKEEDNVNQQEGGAPELQADENAQISTEAPDEGPDEATVEVTDEVAGDIPAEALVESQAEGPDEVPAETGEDQVAHAEVGEEQGSDKLSVHTEEGDQVGDQVNPADGGEQSSAKESIHSAVDEDDQGEDNESVFSALGLGTHLVHEQEDSLNSIGHIFSEHSRKSGESLIRGEESSSDDKDVGSMMTQAGSYGSYESFSGSVESDDISYEMVPHNFQEYIAKYADLFGKETVKEEETCDEEAGKAFLKIDVQELISGYQSEIKTLKDSALLLAGMTRVKYNIIAMDQDPVILRKDYKHYTGVRILSGGHMGYEPLYIDYVGKGMLTGVVLGTVNDPPSVTTITKAMRELVHNSPGLLIIIQNNVEYRLVFGLAMERIRMEGYQNVDMVIICDDCYERCKSPVGRRGLAGIVLLFKLAGSMADSKRSLREIYVAVRCASKTIVTISAMTKPFKAIGTGLDKNSKYGINFKGDYCQMIKRMIDYCLHPMRYFSMRLDNDDSLIVLINSYRSKTPEFYILVNYIILELERRGVNIVRVYADNFVTGFWPGFSISLLVDCNYYRTKLMDLPTSITIWPKSPSNGSLSTSSYSNLNSTKFPEMGPILPKTESKMVKSAVVAASKAIILCENVLNTMHFFGNYGTKLRIGSEAILQACRQKKLNFNRPFNLLIEISELLVEHLPGATGAMYGCLFEGAARTFVRSPLTSITSESWSGAMDEALKTLRAYTNAKGGIVSLALSLIPVVMAIHGPMIYLSQIPSKNPILSALESLRHEIEDRIKKSADEKESLLKNQLDVESYALIIWLHAIYSSIYWTTPSDSFVEETVGEAEQSVKSSDTSRTSSAHQMSSTSKRSTSLTADILGINESLDFLGEASELYRTGLIFSESQKSSTSQKASTSRTGSFSQRSSQSKKSSTTLKTSTSQRSSAQQLVKSDGSKKSKNSISSEVKESYIET